MNKAKHHLWRHYRDTPFEVMSVILFSALTFGGCGAALAHNAAKGSKTHPIQAALAQHQHAAAAHPAKPATVKHV